MLKVTVNGFELAYERLGRGKQPLVLLHGYPLDHTIWDPLIPLMETDFDLILPDLRGFGESRISGVSYKLTDMAADVTALLDSLNIQRTALAGHSMGGYIALAFAIAYPDRMVGLGLVASQAVADPPERKTIRYQTAERVEANGVGEVAESMPPLLTSDPVLQSQLKQLILRQSSAGVAGALRAIAERSDSTLNLPEFDIPVVLIHGLADKLIPIERAKEIKGFVKRGYLTELEGVAHMPMMEAPRLTAEALKVLK